MYLGRSYILFLIFIFFPFFSFQSSDLDRTIGINTKYLDTLDFNLESKDKAFLVEVRFDFKSI